MGYKIVSANSPNELTNIVNEHLQEGWEIVGSHQVMIIHSQNRFRGDQHIDTRNELEYTQTLSRKIEKNVIEVDVAFYHPDDDESVKVFDDEGMREEFEYKLSQLIKN